MLFGVLAAVASENRCYGPLRSTNTVVQADAEKGIAGKEQAGITGAALLQSCSRCP